ncbi:ribosome-inactivating family protein [Streptomyces sp. NPDC047042]|uniref:ribosome-inactivating family protein n=1 Tax=Streptomyces sp. NPDC047042 TaxID=3154807 RepID=UPI00340213F2
MNRRVIDEAPASHREPSAAPPRRSLSLVSGGPLARPRTITLLAALVLGLIATLVGPMGKVPTARASDGNPVFRIGIDDGIDYVGFINELRRRLNDGLTSRVPGAGDSYMVQHTNTTLAPGTNFPAGRNRHDAYLQVDIQMWGNPNFVRLQLQRSNLYIIGWWDRNNVYHYTGSQTVPQEERERMDHGAMRNASSIRRAPFGENYVSIEGEAHEDREWMPVNRDTISAAAWYLFDANNDQNMARGFLRMAQFVAEAARLRPMRDGIALVMGNAATYHIPAGFVWLQNNWGRLSDRFNWLLGMPQGYRDTQPIRAYRRDAWGDAVQIVLYTAIQYAQYVLGIANGRR